MNSEEEIQEADLAHRVDAEAVAEAALARKVQAEHLADEATLVRKVDVEEAATRATLARKLHAESRTNLGITVAWVLGGVFIVAMNLIGLYNLKQATEEVKTISEERLHVAQELEVLVADVKDLVEFTNEINSPDARKAEAEQLNALVDTLQQQVDCNSRDLAQELVDGFEANGVLPEGSMSLICPPAPR